MTFRKFFENRPGSDFFSHIQDFLTTGSYTAADWTITNTGSPTIAVGTGLTGGILELTTGATSGNNTFHDLKISAFKFQTGKALEFETRLKLDNVLDTDFVCGLQITDTTPLAVSDGIWFGKDNGDALLDIHMAKASTQTDQLGLATLVADTYVKLGFYYDGSDPHVQVFLNDVRVAGLPLTNAPTTQQLCVSIGVQTNSANARKLSVDYFRVHEER